MDKKELINKILSKQKTSLSKAIEKAREARDNAPSAMESHSDTSRSQNEKLVNALEDQLKEIVKLETDIDSSNLSYFEIKINFEIKRILIVPESLGGTEIDGIRLMSPEAPLGQLIIGKKIGDKFKFNEQDIEIVKVEEL